MEPVGSPENKAAIQRENELFALRVELDELRQYQLDCRCADFAAENDALYIKYTHTLNKIRKRVEEMKCEECASETLNAIFDEVIDVIDEYREVKK